MSQKRPPDVDLVLSFRATKNSTGPKHRTREEARKAEQQYKRLIETLTYAGLKAVGRRGESLGHILVFITCPPKHVEELVKRERHSDFLSGLPVTPATTALPLSPADRIRLVHAYISSSPADGGLGISPDATEWDLVDSIFPLHDKEFNDLWVRAWTPRNMASVQLERIREQFGDALAFYFAFLASYTRFLVAPAALGVLAHFFFPAYSPVYSVLISVWGIAFVEWWRVKERKLSLRFATRGSFKVERRRAQYKQGIPWWRRELRVLASIPVIIFFAGLLSAILTGIFVFEAFVTQLYQGPGKQLITFSPTILFIIFVPRVLAVYQAVAVRLTNWENHAHQSTHTASLTLKTFALSAIVAYLGLGLSAFVYVPFGEGVMRWVQAWLFGAATTHHGFKKTLFNVLNGTVPTVGKGGAVVADTLAEGVKGNLTSAAAAATGAAEGATKQQLWNTNPTTLQTKLNPGRLKDQMFAYTVTNQIVNTFMEVGLPFVLRSVANFRQKKAAAAQKEPIITKGDNSSDDGAGRSSSSSSVGSVTGAPPRKRVVFEDEKERGGMAERVFLDSVRAEAALPAYEIFVDYSEMVVQFGYVVLWSTIWPLAGAMAFLNNLLELRSDAFKMTVHNRRPIPSRTDTIGPWLDALTFLTWLGALTNSALVYLFSPQLLPTSITSFSATTNSTLLAEEHLVAASGGSATTGATQWGVDGTATPASLTATEELLMKAVIVALVASHGFILVRLVIRHVVEKMFWASSGEVEERERREREVKVQFLKGAGVELVQGVVVERTVDGSDGVSGETEVLDEMEFYGHDEGLDEINRISKEA